ncbi:MAG: hypothetical protein ACTS3F_10820 [Phycisphaerales bacterium]
MSTVEFGSRRGVGRGWQAAMGCACVALMASAGRAGTAQIVQGWDNDAGFRKAVETVVIPKAKSNLEDKGHATAILGDQNAGPTAAAVINALNNAQTNAFFILGHGLKVGDNYTASIRTEAGGGARFTPGANVWPNVKYVHLASCGQDLAAWKTAFPNATFVSYKNSVSGLQILGYEEKKAKDNIPQRADGDGGGGDGPGTDISFELDPVLNAYYEQVTLQPTAGGQDATIFSDHTLSPFWMNDTTGAAFGNTSFTIRLVGGEGPVDLMWFRIEDSRIVEQSYFDEPTPTPGFVFEMTDDAFFNAWADISSLETSLALGEIGIAENFAGIDPQAAFDGVSAAIWSVNSVPSPGASVLALGGLLALRRRRR